MKRCKGYCGLSCKGSEIIMPKYSYKINRPTATMTVYEDGRTLCIANDITRAVNLKKAFYDIVYELRGVDLKKMEMIKC